MLFKRKITGIYKELSYPLWVGVLFIAVSAAVIYLPRTSNIAELMRKETLYAVIAGEFSFKYPVPTAHHIQQLSGEILFSATATVIHKLTGLTIAASLRTLALIMMLMTSLLAGIAVYPKSRNSALVTAAATLTTLVAIDKGVDGYPTAMNTFFLLSAQLAFFFFGIRRANWNKAWIISSLLISLAFLSGGFRMLLFFIFPMFFLRRPLSTKSKFNKPGFTIALMLLTIVTVGHLMQFSAATGKSPLHELVDAGFQDSNYWENVLTFPIMLPVRLLPWSLLMWLPFCVALQAIDTMPVFSRYLRTISMTLLLLLWLLPEQDARELMYAVPSLAILTGLMYEIGMKRYGNRIRRFLVLGELLLLLILGAYIAALFLPDNIINSFIRTTWSLGFRNTEAFRLGVFSAMGCTAVIGVCFYYGRIHAPVWMLLLSISVATGIFFGSVIAPYNAQDQRKRTLASDIAKASEKENIRKLYKCDIRGFYGGLFYTGKPVYHLNNVSELPEHEETVYLISPNFPQTLNRNWENLLPSNYTYQQQKISLWKGVLKENSEYPQ